MGGGAQKGIKALLPGVLVVLAIAGCGGAAGTNPGVTGRSARPHASREKLPPEEFQPGLGGRERPRPRRLARACGPAQLVVSHEGGAAGAMSTYYAKFTVFNLSEHACSIGGYPKLFALGVDGRIVQGPTRYGTGAAEGSDEPLNIPEHGSAFFRVSWPADIATRSKCGSRIVAGYRVVLPGSDLAQTIPYPNFEHCHGSGYGAGLSVGVIQPSVAPVDRHLTPPPLEQAKPAVDLPVVGPPTSSSGRGSTTPAAPRRAPPTPTSK